MPGNRVMVNRAPVLTLWGAVVAARMGYQWEEALTLGKAVAGLNAQAKGRRLGIFAEPKTVDGRRPKKVGLGEEFWVEVVGRPVPAKRTEDGVRAVVGAEPIDPGKVERYLRSRFKENLEAVREAMEAVAGSFDEKELAEAAYGLYERFRPKIAAGKRGWGQKGELDLELMRSLAK
ncbi:MAG: hypothetical protein JSV79_06145 [Armatimonadota bacterium]|nr:MAG: hypothetical protein JSV79_06145 [Armatimonadota bacterium]